MIIRFLKAVYAKWMALAHVMGIFGTFVFMSIIYFIFVPLFSLVRFSDPLKLKWKKDDPSYWLDKTPIDTSIEGMKRLY